jgi:hypothetical protein
MSKSIAGVQIGKKYLSKSGKIIKIVGVIASYHLSENKNSYFEGDNGNVYDKFGINRNNSNDDLIGEMIDETFYQPSQKIVPLPDYFGYTTMTIPELPSQPEKAKSDIVGFNYHQICPNAIRRIATIFHAGAKQYGENNYQKGINDPVWQNERFNHAMDHLLKYREGDRSEDHLAKVGWYVCVLMGFEFDKEKINAAKEENAAEK